MNISTEGYMKDGKNRLIPLDQIKPIDLTRHHLVEEIVQKAKVQSAAMASFKVSLFGDIDAFIHLAAEQYDANLGGVKGNVTLTSFDGQYKVIRAINETLAFDEGLLAAKALIDECMHEWSQGARSEIKAIINDAFQVDKQGQISTGRILGLRRLAIADPKWVRAMGALADSIRVQCSKDYVRVYERTENGKYQQIPLDMAGV
ncbi:MAG: DUF3164 family protein [Proteobacteria bacterium]|nr:DUF3164 family protein [Pseudomonadota bacterium]